MIVVDINLLIYAYNTSAPDHLSARTWLEEMFSGSEVVGLPWAVLHGFLRIVTSPAILPHPFEMQDAVDLVDEWLGAGDARVLEAGPRYWSILKDVIVSGRIRGAMLMDAHLAALAIEYDATLFTADNDFQRFDRLRVVNPLSI